MTMDYTEKICVLIPQQLWHWRPEDPQGHFQASLGDRQALGSVSAYLIE
jgi:hypothetical protein